MKRRQFVQRTATVGLVSISGCIGDRAPGESVGDSNGERDECENTTAAGPGGLHDSLTLYQLPEYVEEYSGSVVVRYDDLGDASKTAVRRALSADGAYRECTRGTDRTSIKALAAHIEHRWEAVGREAFQQTYLHYQGSYYGIALVQEGDFVRVDSIPCRQEECPTTPTPPS